MEAVDELQCCRFSSAASSQQGQSLAFFHHETYVFKNYLGITTVSDVVKCNLDILLRRRTPGALPKLGNIIHAYGDGTPMMEARQLSIYALFMHFDFGRSPRRR